MGRLASLSRLAAADEDHAAAGGAGLHGGAPGVGPPDGLEHDVVVGEALGAHRARLLGLGAALGVAVGERDRAALGDQQRGEHLAHRAAAEHAHVGRDLLVGRAGDRVDGGGQRLRHGGGGRVEPVRHGVQGRLGRGRSRSAKPPKIQCGSRQICGGRRGRSRQAPQATESPTSTRSPVSSRTPQVSWPNTRRVGAEQRVPAAPGLDVGAAGGRRLDAHKHLAGAGHGVGGDGHAAGGFSLGEELRASCCRSAVRRGAPASCSRACCASSAPKRRPVPAWT